MPHDEDHSDEILATAVELAREVAGELDAVLLTHYADAETLDMLRPGESDLTTVGAEIEEFLDEAGAQTRGLEEIVACVTAARRKAGDEEVVCRAEIVGEGLELSLYTGSGRFLDGLTLPEERLPAKAVEMPALLESFVRMVRDAPGR
ncbi:hypothetical protein [Roseomonas populi]|uniref:Uncharacterized protein n=1 Tax=Roseomonas populi TaxID=3121582 RepID=A0ABT1XC35_9PROT|nr:hypothetical protein [Roseomonas pecuniae]MCR0985695.1 hypothetical protein [Roseomonas pecuniae]